MEAVKSFYDGSSACGIQKDKIIISGISGMYPKCNNIAELAEKLFSQEDLITDMININFSAGKLSSVNKFDAEFFGVTNEHGEYMDPLCRILLEKTYEAIVDAGFNPEELKNSNTAVFVANCTSDAEIESTFRTDIKGALICERAQSFLANRISYCFGLNGPSGTVNTACSSSLYALDFACKAIKNGECDAAIVGASNLCLSPGMINLYKNLGITSTRCRSFDDAAVGFCRSEAISAILLQKEKQARRLYAEVVHVKTNNDGIKKQSILFPSHQMQIKLIDSVYRECNVPKCQVAWVEAHGTGTRVGDYQEMKSLETLCENRKDPLLVGCVKSNLGHTEAASGLCSIAKVILSMEMGLIPPNLHFSKPQNGIEALLQNKIQVIKEITPWDGGYVAINNFGIGGANAHLLLRSNLKKSADVNMNLYVPRLVTVSGRTSEAVETIISYLQLNPINYEFIGLLYKIFSFRIPTHQFRGYIILNDRNSTQIGQIKQTKENKRPIWFIYPGMGSQWTTMAKELLQLETFNKSILECHSILEIHNVNLLEILTSENSELLLNITNCFVGITAFMIALTDTIMSLGIEPDGFIGHSFGEIGCAYVDKCFSKKEALMTAYYRGITSLEIDTVKGYMAVIGLSGNEMEKRTPKSIKVVCHNGVNSCTIAGPAEDIEQMVCNFKMKNIFATIIYSANIAYHSPHIQELGPVYKQYLEKVIHCPRKRSEKWISSSISDYYRGTDDWKYCSPRYFENNFLSSVQFEMALKHIPNNAITVEIAPHSIFKSVLNDSLNSTISNISLINRNDPEPLHHLLTSLGRLYEESVDMDLSRLYPAISFPVSRGTPMISPLIKWNHEKDWYVPFQTGNLTSPNMQSGKRIVVSYENEEYRFLQDCIIDERNVFPESGILKIVWITLAERYKLIYSEMSVIFRNIKFHKVVEIPKNDTLNFSITVAMLNGYFEVILNYSLIANGYVEKANYAISKEVDESNYVEGKQSLKTSDVYKELRINGYNYGSSFQTLISCNIEGTMGKIKWTDNWILYLDGLFQFLYLQSSDNQNLCALSEINSLQINVAKHEKFVKHKKELIMQSSYGCIQSGGVKLTGFELKRFVRKVHREPVLQNVEFVSYFNYAKNVQPVSNIVQIIAAIVIENNLNMKINLYEFVDIDQTIILANHFHEYFKRLSFFKTDIMLNTYVSGGAYHERLPSYFRITDNVNDFLNKENLHLIILPNSVRNLELLMQSQNVIADSGFILTREETTTPVFNTILGLEISAVYFTSNEKLILWHKVSKYDCVRSFYINTDSFEWVENLKLLIKGNKKKIILYSDQKHSGIIGFYNCIRKESCGRNIRCFLMLDSELPSFDVDNPFYSNQIKLDMAVNVYKNGSWGCYIPFKIESEFYDSVTEADLLMNVNDDEVEFHWVQKKINSYKIKDNTKEKIYLYYVGLSQNYFDLITFSRNSFKKKDTIFEFSGKISSGKRIMGISFNDIISTTLKTDDSIYWDIPDTWSMQAAVTIPIPYLTALLLIKETDKNSTILIQNSYSSYYGRALLTVALYYGLKVFSIENNQNEANWIQLNFPQMAGSFFSESIDVLKEVLNDTEENGINIFVIIEFQDYIYETLDLVSKHGRIMYVGQNKDIYKIVENIITRGIQFHSINQNHLIYDPRMHSVKNLFRNLMKKGVIQPPENNPNKITVKDKISKNTFRSNRILQVRDNSEDSNTCVQAAPLFSCSGNDTYIICGGLGGMGFELTDWLINRGARKLILVSRTGYCDSYKIRKITKWRTMGVTIVISIDNICAANGVSNLLKSAAEIGNVSGIFNTTLILQDNLFENQNIDSFQNVANPKAVATVLLDKLSRIMCPHLKHFVVFSSIVCGYGNAGQSNYGFANSVMERICEIRRNEGLPGLAIEWAGVADVGYLENIKTNTAPGGTLLQPIRSCLKVLDLLLCSEISIVTSFIVADDQITEQPTGSTLFTTIRKIIDKPNGQINSDTTLKDIGLDSIAIAETKNILEREYNIFLDTKEIVNLKVIKLWEIEKNNKRKPSENKSIEKMSVLEEVYANLFEIISKTKEIFNLKLIVRLPSFLHNGAINEVQLTRERTIFFLPSIEGFASVMYPLAKNIDLQVLCAQYSLRTASIKEITSILLPEIENRLATSEPFHLLGYSYGGIITMEIAHALEKKGRKGFLYLIDSSPKIVKWISKMLFKDRGFFTNLMAFARALNSGVNLQKFEEEIIQKTSWESASKFTIDFLPDTVQIEKKYLKTILNTLHERNNEIDLYNGIPKKSLASKIFFFRPKDTILDIPTQHALSEYCSTPVSEFIIDGNHFTILKSERLAYYLMNLYKTMEI